MGYLSASEFETYGLSASTSEGMVEAASALLDAHCRRKSLERTQYTERLRVSRSGTVRLTYLPLSSDNGATAIVSARGRYGAIASQCSALAHEVGRTFGLGGSWVDLPAETLDVMPETGEITLGVGVLGLAFDEVEITYTAGLSPVNAAVKHACAMVVRNALATPALNVRGAQVDSMHMEYFSDALIDSNVRKLLAPYLAQKVG